MQCMDSLHAGMTRTWLKKNVALKTLFSRFKSYLWISHWISTASNVQNSSFCSQENFYPPTIQRGYNVFQGTCKRCKPLSLLIKFDLSTENVSFTITTKFVYIYLYKTVNAAEKWTTLKNRLPEA